MTVSRRLVAGLHRWGGLVAGPMILALGLSGAVLVFRPELQDVERGSVIVTPGTSVASHEHIIAAALGRYPGATAQALHLPGTPDRACRVVLASGRQRIDVAVDPYTARVLDARAHERSLLAAVYSLHTAFHAGRVGMLVVGLLGLWVVVESATGLRLCRPSRVAPRRRSWSWRSGRARWPGVSTAATGGGTSRALHVLIGALSLALGLIVTLTGSALALYAAFARVDPAGAAPAARAGLAGLDVVAARAEVALSGGRISAFVALGDGTTVRVEKRLPAATGTRDVAVVVDRATGAAVAAPEAESGRGVQQLVRRLHAGDFAAWPVRVVYGLLGLTLPVLAVTGYLISARRPPRRG